MRGGADTDEKMGHEQDASPNPRAVCHNFQLSAHCQSLPASAVRHVQTLWLAWWSKGEPGVSGIKDKPQLVHKALPKFNLHSCSYSSLLKLKIDEDEEILSYF